MFGFRRKDSTPTPPGSAPDSRQQKGEAAELRARIILEKAGLQVVASNFRVRGGEIDLICLHGSTLVFVEVRERADARFGGAAASITPTKQRRIILAAQCFLQRHPAYAHAPCRFDCVVFDGTSPGRWLQDAFQMAS